MSSGLPTAHSDGLAPVGMFGCRSNSSQQSSITDPSSIPSSAPSNSSSSVELNSSTSVLSKEPVPELDKSESFVRHDSEQLPLGLQPMEQRPVDELDVDELDSEELDRGCNGDMAGPSIVSDAGSMAGASTKPHASESICSSETVCNRVAIVRKQQGVTERTVARRLGIDVRSYRELENPSRDLRLSELKALRNALEVPLEDLIVDRQSLSRPIEERAKLVKIMKTAAALRELPTNARAARMSKMLCEQLVDLMPELEEVSGWPQFGARRGSTAIGKALQQPIDLSSLGLQD